MAKSDEGAGVAETAERRLGVRLRREREARGWSQQEVANRLGDRGISLHMSAIAKIEAGSRTVRLNEAVALAEVFDMKVEELSSPPVNELNEIIELLQGALTLHRDADRLAKRGLDRIWELTDDFDTESGPLRHPGYSGRITDLVARLSEYHRQEPHQREQG
ncbi:helix-turn-helix domain-containing protein [Pimelobacter simplex]|uniref:helix-turn-helix domain-containing protein n=1 Tax=Nocardioides simplex TaxID=2045 RepID=UPI001932996B|nr:helix-turn-helix transcriptional regulator [Pimelobacter simplex]